MSRIKTFVYFVFISTRLFSQPDTIKQSESYFSVGIRFHKGFIIPHSEAIKSISYSKPWITEADFAWHLNSMKAYSYGYCFPRLGISAMFINFDNPAILGRAYSIAPYVEPFFSAHKKFSTSFRFVAGAVLLDNVYDSLSNPLNLFYSSPVSFILSASFTVNYRFVPQWNSRITVNYNHISNGGNREPNKGINFPTLSLGFDYIFRPINFQLPDKENIKKNSKFWEFRVGVLNTSKKPVSGENKRYWVYGLSAQASYLFGRISALTGGVDFVADESIPARLKLEGKSLSDFKRVGLLAGHELQIGRVRFSQQLGVYIYSPIKAKDPVYQRWGLDYVFGKHIFGGVNLKSHRHVADFMDVRIGWLLK